MIRELIRDLIESMPPKAKTFQELEMQEGLVEAFMSGKILMGHDPEQNEICFRYWDKELKK